MNRSDGLTLKFKVDELLEALRKNRDDHRKIYEESVAGFKKAFKKKLQNFTNMLEKGEVPQPNLGLTLPTNHLPEYHTAIRMLDMTTETELELTQAQFNCYVMDQWHFQQNFLRGALSYDSIGASRKLLDTGA